MTGIFQDVGSGINDSRRGLLRLIRGCAHGRFDVVVATYPDRLARFSLQVLRECFAMCHVRL